MRLTLSELSASRNDRPLFHNISMDIDGGSCLKLSGPNGAGKTTLLRIISGFLQPTRGFVEIKTRNGLFREAEARGAHIGWMGSQDAIEPRASVIDQLRFFAGLYLSAGTSEKYAEIERVLQKCGLTAQENQPGGKLSAGQRRRFALARLMLMARPLWLMDEPLAMLDSRGRDTIRTVMSEHCAAGGIIVTAGHDTMEIAGPHMYFEAA